MACNSDTECIICFEECTSDDNYMNTRVVSDISGNVDSTICNCSYNLHQSCYLEYIKKFNDLYGKNVMFRINTPFNKI